jgi:phage gpG-like protein
VAVSASLSGDFADLRRLIRAARHLATPKGQTGVVKAAAWGAIGALEERFATATDPKGRPWKPSLRAQLEGGQTLSDTGRLRRSFSVQAAGPWGFTIGTNVRYAAPHQFGATITPKRARYLRFRLAGGRGRRKGGKGRWVTATRVDLPVRPFFPEGNDLGRYAPHMAEAIQTYLRRALG